MVTLFINGVLVRVPEGSSVLQACCAVGYPAPRFCFHEKLRVAGNCRICLVEVSKLPKPVASCAIPVVSSIQIFTNTPLVRKAREAAIEFLLLNHPLDCPVCDQGGECDLQNQSISWGGSYTRNNFVGRKSVVSKFISLHVYLVLTRCILCTRCIRFVSEVSGTSLFGVVGRGCGSEVSSFKPHVQAFDVLVSNTIDICPVGLLTLRIY